MDGNPSEFLTIIPSPSNFFHPLLFSFSPTIDLASYVTEKNRSLHIPANKLPILWALTPLSSLSYQKWSLHICSQSLWAPSPPTLPSAISSPVCSPHSRKWASWAPNSLVTLFFFLSIVDLQCCVHFWCTKWFSYTCVFFHMLSHHSLLHDIEYI